MAMLEKAYLVPLFPLIGFLLNGLAGGRYSRKLAGLIGCTTIGLSFLASLSAFAGLLGLPAGERVVISHVYSWITAGAFNVDLAFRFDPLSIVMALVVSGVGFLIHVYSVGYMHDDPGYSRYFAYLNLFAAMMLTLVLADNLLLMFVGWEGVGLCSYLLIGFWFEKKTAADAGKKAFIVNRIGDFGFLLGIFLIFWTVGRTTGVWTLAFGPLRDTIAVNAGLLGVGFFTVTGLLMFLGATGKSAQLPLYVWLPDAMEGPTPVSALIHAATMVTAGVYMIARLSFIYVHSATALMVVAVVGAATALFAATMGTAQNDIKRVLAYSTISQLGYMFMAVGVGAFAAGIFHLMTHAFFKALLFLGAGSVIHAMSGEQDMRKMGALRKALPLTYGTMLVATLAIAGIPGLSGFFSKDEILWKASGLDGSGYGHMALWVIGALTAAMTAFYMFRLFFLTFFGESRVSKEAGSRLHESPRIMTVPLVILAVLALAGGYIGVPQVIGDVAGWEHSNKFAEFLDPSVARTVEHGGALHEGELHAGITGFVTGTSEVFASDEEALHHGEETGGSAVAHTDAHHHGDHTKQEWTLMGISVLVALLGIFAAYRIYIAGRYKAEPDEAYAGIHKIVYRKYYVDEIYDRLFVRSLGGASREFFWKVVDVKLIDGLVNGIAALFRSLGGAVGRLHTGFVQNYAFGVITGVILIAWYVFRIIK